MIILFTKQTSWRNLALAPLKLRVFCFLPLDGKTYDQMQVDWYNLELLKFKGCKPHHLEGNDP